MNTYRLALTALLTFLLNVLVIGQIDTTHLRIIVTSDIHGNILPFDLIEGKNRNNSMSQVHSFVTQERQRTENEIILLDNGDILQGDPFVYYYNFVDTTGYHPLALVMNFMEFDAATIGNHDIEAGPDVYNKLTKQFNFPWLGANVMDSASGKPYFKPYTILERDGIRIVVLGLTTPHVPFWLPPKLWRGLRFGDMIYFARKWSDYIELNEKPHLLIGLFHSGGEPIDPGFRNQQQLLENASRVIAEEIGGFDIIFTGHDHRRWNEFVANADDEYTLLLGSGSHARAVAVAGVKLVTQNNDEILFKEIRGNIVDITRYKSSSNFAVRFLEYLYPVQQYVDEFITFTHDTIRSRPALFGSSAFVDLVHQAQLKITQADISFAAPLLMDVTIPAGKLTRKDFFELYRFENYLYVMTLSGREIRNFLEYSYAYWMNHMRSQYDHLLLKRKDEAGTIILNSKGKAQLATPHFNFESAAGIKYTVNVALPPGARVTITGFENGLPFHNDSTYRVAVNSYRASGGGGHLTTGAGIAHDELRNRIIWQSENDIRALLMDWMKNNPAYRVEARKNWMVVPKSWAERGMKKDMRLLFDY